KDDTPAGTDTPAADDNVTHINPNITHESEQTEDNPPTAEELFHGLMTRYRNEHESKTKGEA
ncbi:hypothetical protein, partial [Anaerotignum faecicola]|uniref:hypothetical protein n=1 Tax=Anaerotignum faecicola TaxID=2358141 RepID=UPI003FD773A1